VQSRRVAIESPAKLNLSLNIYQKRNDGYHELRSLMHTVRFADTLHLTFHEGHGRVRILGNPGVEEKSDLCYRAAWTFMKSTALDIDIEVHIQKRIPIGGGLGGGSSNAAATLRALDALYPDRIDRASLHTICASLGSDVPFFLYAPAANVCGRGEIVASCPPSRPFPVVIAYTGVAISTAAAFGWLDDCRLDTHYKSSEIEQTDNSMLSMPPDTWQFTNDFTAILTKRHPPVRKAIDAFRDAGAAFVNVTGTGGCVYAIFTDELSAHAATSAFQAGFAWKTRLLESTIPPVLQ
jgi:4-diphosphocytidyl-2-C-methyl-D-erythritol kinase